MKRGLCLKQLEAEFRMLKREQIVHRIATLGYRKEYLTNEEYKHILARRKIQNETTT
jgi:hypothetical protein